MEPKLPTPNLGPEQSHGYYGQSMERVAEGLTPEKTIERRGEQLERQHEVPSEGTQPAVAPASIALPTVPPPVAVTPTASPATDDSPLAANDDDLIEKEWVDKAKKIIAETKDDPYRREQEVGRLQADYLRKRYGKELGSPQ
jgi:hypothetical protein